MPPFIWNQKGKRAVKYMCILLQPRILFIWFKARALLLFLFILKDLLSYWLEQIFFNLCLNRICAILIKHIADDGIKRVLVFCFNYFFLIQYFFSSFCKIIDPHVLATFFMGLNSIILFKTKKYMKKILSIIIPLV